MLVEISQIMLGFNAKYPINMQLVYAKSRKKRMLLRLQPKRAHKFFISSDFLPAYQGGHSGIFTCLGICNFNLSFLSPTRENKIWILIHDWFGRTMMDCI
mmetsp:Transcript_20801/g.34298  ORF Transcript_20801/g.34298 Transcript_20801/m.34298 type:complete len:100 (-) Transcript_20801:122-421(-)